MSLNFHTSQRRASATSTYRWLIVAAYFALFSVLLLLPNPLWLLRGLGRRAAAWWDFDYLTTLGYAAHFGGFGLLVLLLVWASPVRGTARYAWPAAAVVLYGALIELVQVPIPNRSFELLDLAANSAGCLFAGALCALWDRRGRFATGQAARRLQRLPPG